MNYKEKIEEIIKKYAKPLGVGLAPDSAWLRDMKFLAEEFADLYEQAQRDAVGGFARWYDQDVFPEKGYAEQMVGKYLNQTKEDINPKEGE